MNEETNNTKTEKENDDFKSLATLIVEIIQKDIDLDFNVNH